jgi:hypothetical protein
MVVVFLLVVIAILLYRRRPDRDYSLSAALLIAAFTWLAIEIHVLRLLQDLVALAVAHWVDVTTALAAAILLVVPAMMLYIAVRDQLDHRAKSPGPLRNLVPTHARHTVLNKFERRVATLMALGYRRTQAEATALNQMKRDLEHYPSTKAHDQP